MYFVVALNLTILILQTLIRLPPNISDCDFVMEFFEVRQTDLEKPKYV